MDMSYVLSLVIMSIVCNGIGAMLDDDWSKFIPFNLFIFAGLGVVVLIFGPEGLDGKAHMVSSY